jgi:hypothetical protein
LTSESCSHRIWKSFHILSWRRLSRRGLALAEAVAARSVLLLIGDPLVVFAHHQGA